MKFTRNIILIFAALACSATAFGGGKAPQYHQVAARANAQSDNWKEYTAKTVDRLPGFKPGKEPARSAYGGWMVSRREATGFFRVEKTGDRWWLIDPEGYPFIHRGVAVFSMGGSDRQKEAFAEKFGQPSVWAESECRRLEEAGFNGLGAWSAVDVVRGIEKPLAYTVILSPMGAYNRDQKQAYGGKYMQSGWQGYRFDLAMVFDPRFDKYVEEALSAAAKYKDDKYLLGYFTDNELPWKNDALDLHLNNLAKDEPGYLAARAWLDARKGKNTPVTDITDEDRLAFTGYYFETYISKVAAALRKHDPNHLYLGCRFNQMKEELTNPEIMRVAGKYMDVVSINHYRLWEPDAEIMANWAAWSGRPFIITEWYTKGEDSGLPNNTGAGWNVPTQQDRGYFYENFAMELLRSKVCVGWHWFTYQDNDPQNLKTDPSNRDSNKGVVTWDYVPYGPLMESMKALNVHSYQLITHFDKQAKR